MLHRAAEIQPALREKLPAKPSVLKARGGAAAAGKGSGKSA
jgi:hypothetical protein